MNSTEIGERLLRAWLELTATLWSRDMVSGMTFNEAVICNLLFHRQDAADTPPITATALCEKTNIRKSQMNRILTSLEDRGYLLRQQSPEDRRQICLTLTPAGEAAYLSAHSRATRLLGAVVSEIGSETAELLTEKLNLANQTAQTFLTEVRKKEQT